MKSFLMVLVIGLVSQISFAAQCPKAIQVSVAGLTSIASTNTAAIQRIFVKGESQTDKAYIQEILKSVNSIQSLNDILVLIASRSKDGNCEFKGSQSTLSLTNGYEYPKVPVANLRIGKIHYKGSTPGSNPTEAWGYQATLKTPLKSFDAKNIVQSGNTHNLIIELNVQIPMGDYGTYGYDVDAKIGQAHSVDFRILN